MDRRRTLRLFQDRLDQAIIQQRISRANLAKRAGIDRSTLTQLLASENTRLPRADTAAALAEALQVSLDWLLGLSAEPRDLATVLHESLEVAMRPQTIADEHLARWHEEAAGYKIRYVPATLPDLTKTDRVLRHEFAEDAAKTAEQAIAASRGKLAYSRLPETDMEICLSRQTLEGFARGEGHWRTLPVEIRIEQLSFIAKLCEELYPKLRVYLFDEMTHYSAPYTVFGPLRAAVFIGQMYFVFNSTEHIHVLTRHFDDLIRAAVVRAHETARFVGLLRQCAG